MTRPSPDLLSTPELNYEQWRDALRPDWGLYTPDDPKSFAGRATSRSICRLKASDISNNVRHCESEIPPRATKGRKLSQLHRQRSPFYPPTGRTRSTVPTIFATIQVFGADGWHFSGVNGGRVRLHAGHNVRLDTQAIISFFHGVIRVPLGSPLNKEGSIMGRDGSGEKSESNAVSTQCRLKP
jgi:hypothetical protein